MVVTSGILDSDWLSLDQVWLTVTACLYNSPLCIVMECTTRKADDGRTFNSQHIFTLDPQFITRTKVDHPKTRVHGRKIVAKENGRELSFQDGSKF